MKNLPLCIIPIISILFLMVSKLAFSEVGDDSQLFSIFVGISNTIALFIPVTIFIFYLLTSSQMFNLLDEKIHPGRMANVICFSFIPVVLSTVIYLLMLYGINPFGLTVPDMKIISYAAWAGFLIILLFMVKEEFELSFFKAVVISLFPTLLVIGLRSIL